MQDCEEMEELVDNFIEKKKIHNFEGTSGIKNLEKIIQAIGYSGTNFRDGSLIETFLADNPAACEAIVDFIKKSNVDEWKDQLGDRLDEYQLDHYHQEDEA